MRLRVLTPENTLVDEDITEVYAPGAAGELGVLPDHITFLGALDIGEVRYRSGKATGALLMSGGVLEVLDDQITILADAAVRPGAVDLATAQKDLAAADTTLEAKATDPASPAYDAARTARRWAQARLEWQNKPAAR
jgi:F-type H+-transporting ATPase subunit epsilon